MKSQPHLSPQLVGKCGGSVAVGLGGVVIYKVQKGQPEPWPTSVDTVG